MLRLEELEVYQLAMEIGDEVYEIVMKWDYFHKNTIGKQYVDAADSISANIAEGYGRYFYKENKLFCYYSRGSLTETKNWTLKAFNRKLIDENKNRELADKLDLLHNKLNAYIKSIGKHK